MNVEDLLPDISKIFVNEEQEAKELNVGKEQKEKPSVIVVDLKKENEKKDLLIKQLQNENNALRERVKKLELEEMKEAKKNEKLDLSKYREWGVEEIMRWIM